MESKHSLALELAKTIDARTRAFPHDMVTHQVLVEKEARLRRALVLRKVRRK